jgi:ABC-type thiamine transport system substrate-binding protein
LPLNYEVQSVKKVLPLLVLFALPAAAKPVLTVYTYDSFSADWGPGPVVKKPLKPTVTAS